MTLERCCHLSEAVFSSEVGVIRMQLLERLWGFSELYRERVRHRYRSLPRLYHCLYLLGPAHSRCSASNSEAAKGRCLAEYLQADSPGSLRLLSREDAAGLSVPLQFLLLCLPEQGRQDVGLVPSSPPWSNSPVQLPQGKQRCGEAVRLAEVSSTGGRFELLCGDHRGPRSHLVAGQHTEGGGTE